MVSCRAYPRSMSAVADTAPTAAPPGDCRPSSRGSSYSAPGRICVFGSPIRQGFYPRTMSTMNISLPSALRVFVDEQVARGGYSTSSEYVRELIRRDLD